MNAREEVFGTDRPVVFVTGSGSPRVGRVVAQHFAKSGYRIVIHAHRSTVQGEALVRELEAQGTEAMLVTGAIDSETEVATWIEKIVERFDRLDVLVHTAAVWEPKPLEEVTEADLDQQIRSNLYGSYYVARSAGLQMVKQAMGGAIILVGDWAMERPYAGFSAYFASKGGIPTLMRSMATELATRNCRIRVNAILPGPVLLSENATEELASRLRQQSLLKRDGTAADVASGALFLAEQPFITGVALPIDGGRSIYSSSDQDGIAHPSCS